MMNGMATSDLIAGAFQIVTALLAIAFKHYLDNRADAKPGVIADVLRPVLLLALAGVAIGVGTAIFGPLLSVYSAQNAEIVIAASCLLLALVHFRSRSGIGSYLLEVTALWLAFVAGWKLFSGNSNADFQTYAVYRWAACAIIGSALIFVFRRAPQN